MVVQDRYKTSNASTLAASEPMSHATLASLIPKIRHATAIERQA